MERSPNSFPGPWPHFAVMVDAAPPCAKLANGMHGAVSVLRCGSCLGNERSVLFLRVGLRADCNCLYREV